MRTATQVPYLCLGDGSAGVGANAGVEAGADEGVDACADAGVDAGVQSDPQAYDAHAYDKILVFDVTALDPLQSDLREQADQLETEYLPLCFAWFFLALSWILPVGYVSLCLNFDAPRGSRLCLAWIAFTVSLLVVLFNVVFWSLFYSNPTQCMSYTSCHMMPYVMPYTPWYFMHYTPHTCPTLHLEDSNAFFCG
jgi:hypothetical protein